VERQKTKDERRGDSFGSRLSTLVSLKVYNLLGQEMRTLVNQVQEPGYYSVTWDGQDVFGTEVSSGIYFYTLTIGHNARTRCMVLMR